MRRPRDPAAPHPVPVCERDSGLSGGGAGGGGHRLLCRGAHEGDSGHWNAANLAC